MPDQRTHDHLIRIGVDKRAASVVQRQTKQIRDLIDGTRGTVRELGRELGITDDRLADYGKSAQALGKQIDRIDESLDQMKSSARSATRELADLGDELDRQYDLDARRRLQEQSITSARDRSELVGDTASRITAIGGLAGGIGGSGAASQAYLAADLLDVTEALTRANAEIPVLLNNLAEGVPLLGKLSTATGGMISPTQLLVGGLAAAAVAGVALHVALDDVSDSTADATRAIQAWLDGQREYFELTATGSREDIQAAIDAKQQQLDIAREQLDELTSTYDEIRQRVKEGVGIDIDAPVTRLLGQFVDDIGGGDVYEKLDRTRGQIKQVEDEVAGLEFSMGRLEGALEATSDATARMVIDETTLRKAREETSAMLIDGYNEETAIRIENEKRVRDWSSEMAEERLKNIAIERDALIDQRDRIKQAYASGLLSDEDYGEELDRLTDSIALLSDEAQFLNDVLIPGAKAREKEARFAKDFYDLVTQGINAATKVFDSGIDVFKADDTAINRARSLVDDYRDQASQIEEQRGITVLREQEDWALEQTRALADHYRDLATLDADYYRERGDEIEDLARDLADIDSDAVQGRIEALRDYNKEAQRAAEDHARELTQIERDKQKSIREAAAGLDSSAVIDARDNAREALAAQHEQYTTEQQRRDEDIQQELSDLRAAAQQRRTERLREHQEQLADMHANWQRERSEAQAAFALQEQRNAENRRVTLQRQQEDWAREDRARQKRLQDQLLALGVYFTGQARSEESHFQRLGRIAADGRQSIVQSFAGLFSDIKQQMGTAGRSGSSNRPKQYALGGTARAGEIVSVGERGQEYAQFLGDVQIYRHGQMPGPNITVPINIQADTGQTSALQGMLNQTGFENRLRQHVQRAIIEFVEGRA